MSSFPAFTSDAVAWRSSDGPSGANAFVDDPDSARVWSRAESDALFHRIVGLTNGQGDTVVTVRRDWRAGLRWARNRPTTAQLLQSQRIMIQRVYNGAFVRTETSQTDDATLAQTIGAAEQRLQRRSKRAPIDLPSAQQYVDVPLWSDATFTVTPQAASKVVEASVHTVRQAAMLAAGYLEMRAASWGVFNTKGLSAYSAGTFATYMQTIRNPEGKGSGWAGITQTDWAKIDIGQLSARALSKCLASANPRAIEPGRYTTILEPEAVGTFMIFAIGVMDRATAEGGIGPYAGATQGTSKLGQRIFDERITISTDPADPACPYMPFDANGEPYAPITWVERGVLKNLPYSQEYGKRKLQGQRGVSNPDAFRMSGGDTSIDEMIATTERGLLVSQFDYTSQVDTQSLLLSTVTRNGVWLIEHGKVKYPVKNMVVLESPLFIGNTVEQLGKPERICGGAWSGGIPYHSEEIDAFTPLAFGRFPVVVPPMKVRDFNFISLSDAV